MLSDILIRLRALFRHNAVEAELEDELRFHFDQQVDRLVQSGLPLQEARRQARLIFGGSDQIKEECREARGVRFVETLAQDVHYALRMLRKSPGFTAVAVLTLALGIGANTAIFSMVDTLVFRQLPVQNPGELVFLVFPRGGSNFDDSFSVSEFREIKSQTTEIFTEASALISGGNSVGADGLTIDGNTQPVHPVFVTGNFFSMLGIQTHVGRFILPTEGNAAGADQVIVLSYRYWKQRFRGDPHVVGRAALINGRPVTIIGVAPKDFLGLTPIIDMQAYLPLGMLTVETGGDSRFLTDPNSRDSLVFARVKPGLSVERANAALELPGNRLAKEYPRQGVETTLRALPLQPPGILNGDNPLPKLSALFLILAGLVLALACLNVANLLLARAGTRRREIAVRAALGATRNRVVRHLLTESLLLALLGGAAGILAGVLAMNALSSLSSVTDAPLVLDFPFSWRVFAFALSATLFTGIIVGIVPAMRASGGNLSNVLHEGGRTSTAGRQRMRNALVGAQVGGSLTLLIVAGLFVRSLSSVKHSDLGFDPKNVLNLTLDPAEIGYSKAQGVAFYNELLSRVRALPSVQSASLAMMVPLGDSVQGDGIHVPGNREPLGGQLHANYNVVSTGYFQTMKIAILSGRDFSEADNEGAARVALINQVMAERFWRGDSPIGRQFTRDSDPNHPLEIIGVVNNSRMEDAYSPFGAAFYAPIAQNYVSVQTLQFRTAGPPQAQVHEIFAIVQQLAATMPIVSVRAMAEALNGLNGLFFFNLGAQLTSALGLLGLTLAVVGVYGVMAYAVSQRTHEIGVRLALGAQRSSILSMICRQGLLIVAVGVIVGLIVAFGVAHLMGGFLVGVSPVDALTYAGVSFLLTLVALAACYFPALRATRVDPMVALRYE